MLNYVVGWIPKHQESGFALKWALDQLGHKHHVPEVKPEKIPERRAAALSDVCLSVRPTFSLSLIAFFRLSGTSTQAVVHICCCGTSNVKRTLNRKKKYLKDSPLFFYLARYRITGSRRLGGR